MTIGRSKIRPEDKEKAKQEKLVLFEVFIDARFADPASLEGTWMDGLKHISFAGVRTAEQAHKVIESVWGKIEKQTFGSGDTSA